MLELKCFYFFIILSKQCVNTNYYYNLHKISFEANNFSVLFHDDEVEDVC